MSFDTKTGPPIAVQVDNLTKRYQLNAFQGSLRDKLAGVFSFSSQSKEDELQSLFALKNVSFSLKKGEALGIVGPNGAGKTTMLKVLSRVTLPTHGTVRVHGRLAALIELGAGFHPDLTGKENIFLNGTILGLSNREIRSKFDQIVDFSGLERFVDTPVKRYSSGMYVRLGFAVAAHTDPEVLLVDEVLAVGDAEFRHKCIQRIRKLLEDGVSVILITHNLFQARAVCDKGIFLLNGQIQTQGSINDAISAYELWITGRSNSEQERNYSQSGHAFDQGLKDLSITKVIACDSAGYMKSSYVNTDPLNIRIYFDAKKLFENLHFDIRVYRTDGVFCFIIRSRDLGLAIKSMLDEGFISIKIREIQLTSGEYYAQIRLRDETDAVTLCEGQSLPFRVTSPNSLGGAEGAVFVPHVENAIMENAQTE